MEYATLTNQNQITVPKVVRDSLGIKPGDKLSFYQNGNEIYVTKSKTIDDLWGIVTPKKEDKTDPHDVWLERANKWYKENKEGNTQPNG